MNSEKKLGRPPKGDQVLGGRLEIRVTPDEKQLFDQAAEIAEMDRSEWIRDTLKTAAVRVVKRAKGQ